MQYTVSCNGRKLDVHAFQYTGSEDHLEPDGRLYYVVSFDSAEPVELLIQSDTDLSQTKILPRNTSTVCDVAPFSIRVKLNDPGQYSVEPDGRRGSPLLLFFNLPEERIPDPQDPSVFWFGPGEHRPGKIELHSGETLYLAEGATVHATLLATGDNITICGRGILRQTEFFRGTVRHGFDFYHCQHLRVSGVIFGDPCFWNIVLRDCCDVILDYCKCCGGRMLNDDAIDICNCTDVTIQHCFLRAQDDLIAIKGEPDIFDLSHFTPDQMKYDHSLEDKSRPVCNILVEHCVMWCDGANVCRYGYECTASKMTDITLRDSEIIHFCDYYRPVTEFWRVAIFMLQSNSNMEMSQLRFENINIHADGNDMIFLSAVSAECPPWVNYGSITDCLFKNIHVSGTKGAFRGEIHLAGHDEKNRVSGIRLENITFFGEPIRSDFPFIEINNMADSPHFL